VRTSAAASASAGVECSLEGPFTTSCSSTNPSLAIYQWNLDDTSACTFTYKLVWGDGTSSTVVVPGGSASSLYVDAHTYRAQGSYSPSLTAVGITGSCTAVDFDYSYTYE
jgi:hypothetical protein